MMRRVLVTGANKGIGLAIVRGILERYQDTYVLLGSRSLDRGQEALQTLSKSSPELTSRVTVLQIDVSSQESINKAMHSVSEKFGTVPPPLYGIVNNAGIYEGATSDILETNLIGSYNVIEAFLPLLQPEGGRIVNVSSGAAPSFVQTCSSERKNFFKNPNCSWSQILEIVDEYKQIQSSGKSFEDAGLGSGPPYGFSKALVNMMTMYYAQKYPKLIVSACTPGFIETDMTRNAFLKSGTTAAEMGMKTVEDGAVVPIKLLLEETHGSGHYFGSDGLRSPLHKYRSPGSAPYTGDDD
uniref:Protochlorophyllide reductase n=1 Tax=Timspurckia oligopyrenoides TaxID=708627 RepID=A0A6T6NVJ0_9RHOD|mmetsp:Transcript_7119/g.12780  ORF Transcript_7119/g.12780 Transcript_7119/m.12780 type:complete len:297 (+) Transcript_7119:488-1378(+)